MKKALVISGGGSKGAFAVGVLKELLQTYPTLDFDIYVGTSTGSLVVSLGALGMIDELEMLYTHITNKDIFIEGNIVERISDASIFDATPLWELIQQNFTDDDYERLQHTGKKVFLNTVCLQTNELSVFTNDKNSIHTDNYKVVQTLNANHFRRAMLASCCQPVFMQPIRVNKGIPGAENQDLQYVDGGVLEYIGLQMAIDAGADLIFAILLSAEDSFTTTDNKDYKNLMDILVKTIDILTSDVGKNNVEITGQYNDALSYIDEVKKRMKEDGMSDDVIQQYFTLSDANIFQNRKPHKIFTIRPAQPLGGGPGGLTFVPAEMSDMEAKGESAFNQFAATLTKDDIDKIILA